MNKKYIDADFLKQKISREWDRQELYLPVHFFEAIDDLPAADVQEVVRCKDCKYAKEARAVFGIVGYKCLKHGDLRLGTKDYCSYGKRKVGVEE